MKSTVFGVVVGALVAGTASVAGAHTNNDNRDDGAIHACVDKDRGTIRLVERAGACHPRREFHITWNRVGPKGPKGESGPGGTGSGARGPAGATGLTGPAGPAGPVGAAGPAGPTGAIGPVGPTGATGPVGPAGAKGDKGDTGATGAAGPQGATGLTGAQGPSGQVGSRGETGARGLQGVVGLQGAQGVRGDKGDTGDTGEKGEKGDPGAYGSPNFGGAFGLPSLSIQVTNCPSNTQYDMGISDPIELSPGSYRAVVSSSTTLGYRQEGSSAIVLELQTELGQPITESIKAVSSDGASESTFQYFWMPETGRVQVGARVSTSCGNASFQGVIAFERVGD